MRERIERHSLRRARRGRIPGTTLCQRLRWPNSRAARVRAPPVLPALRGIEWLTGDFADIQHVKEAIHGCDTVFHLANATTPASANQDKIADLQSNVASTLGLLDACRDLGIKRIIFISSGGTIYGLPKQVPTPESAPTMPITAYGISKLSIENTWRSMSTCMASSIVYSGGQPFGPYQTAIKSRRHRRLHATLPGRRAASNLGMALSSGTISTPTTSSMR